MKTGSICLFAGSLPPAGFLECDGSAVSRTTYPDLFGIIGTAYGAGDGSTTFNIPDLSGRVVVGSSASYAIGSAGGEESHTLLTSEIPGHLHEVPQHGHENDFAVTTPELTHAITQPAFNYNRPNGTTQKLSVGGGGSRSGTTSTAASRSASVAIADHPSSALTISGGVADAPAFDTGSVGLGYAHDNMQPYITLKYVIYTGVEQ